MAWTEEQVATLRRLRAENKSFTQCAAELGVTPGAVAGKVNRLRGYKRKYKRVPREQRKRCGVDFFVLDETDVLAAAMVADGDSPAAVASELGLTIKGVRDAVERSKARERAELQAADKRTAWGQSGSARDA